MKKCMSLVTLLTAIVMLVGCGDKKSKPTHHKKEHHQKEHKSQSRSMNKDKNISKKPKSEYQKFCTKCNMLLEDCRCYL